MTSLICFFFQTAISALAYGATFSDNFILGEATFSHFFRATTSTQQLLFRDSHFFRTAAFIPFFRAATFSQEF